MIKNNLYFRNVSRRWKKEAVSTNSLTFFSPYITSSTAETVLLENEHLSCEIYTVFKAENFACRASSLKTLKKLIKSGCELFHIDDLHAKVMLSDDFVSIGSQNLTNKGKSNLEASFCSEDQNFIKYTHTEVESWINAAEEITLAMIEDMESEVTPLFVEYDKLKQLFHLADEVIAQKGRTRQKLKENKLKKILEHKERLRQLAANARNIAQSSKSILANVQELTNQGWYGDTYTYSLVPWKKNASFLHWQVNKKVIELKKQQRYLFMDTESGRISWARVNKGRITYFSDAISRFEKVTIGSWECQIRLKANWSDNQTKHNLTISIDYLYTNIILVYECHFDLKFITNISLNEKESQRHTSAKEIVLWNKAHIKEFSNSISYHILSPFVYNKALGGKQANKFFVQPFSWRKIKLGVINGYPILLSKFHR